MFSSPLGRPRPQRAPPHLPVKTSEAVASARQNGRNLLPSLRVLHPLACASMLARSLSVRSPLQHAPPRAGTACISMFISASSSPCVFLRQLAKPQFSGYVINGQQQLQSNSTRAWPPCTSRVPCSAAAATIDSFLLPSTWPSYRLLCRFSGRFGRRMHGPFLVAAALFVEAPFTCSTKLLQGSLLVFPAFPIC